MSEMPEQTLLRFYRVGSLHAIAVLATRDASLQPLYLPCPRCGIDYVANAAKLHPGHGMAEVLRYPAIEDVLDLADERLMLECPDHAYGFDV